MTSASLKTMPDCTSRLTGLTRLDMSDNQLEGIASALSNLTRLESLDLSTSPAEWSAFRPQTLNFLHHLPHLSDICLTGLPFALEYTFAGYEEGPTDWGDQWTAAVARLAAALPACAPSLRHLQDVLHILPPDAVSDDEELAEDGCMGCCDEGSNGNIDAHKEAAASNATGDTQPAPWGLLLSQL